MSILIGAAICLVVFLIARNLYWKHAVSKTEAGVDLNSSFSCMERADAYSFSGWTSLFLLGGRICERRDSIVANCAGRIVGEMRQNVAFRLVIPAEMIWGYYERSARRMSVSTTALFQAELQSAFHAFTQDIAGRDALKKLEGEYNGESDPLRKLEESCDALDLIVEILGKGKAHTGTVYLQNLAAAHYNRLFTEMELAFKPNEPVSPLEFADFLNDLMYISDYEEEEARALTEEAMRNIVELARRVEMPVMAS